MWFDLYALCASRTTELAGAFRTRWATGLQEAAVDYYLPQYAERPEIVFGHADQLISVLTENRKTEPHAVYWTNTDGPVSAIRSAMLFFTTDCGMIAGLSLAARDSTLVSIYLRQLAESVGARYAYVTSEDPPPETQSDFLNAAKACAGPRLVDGVWHGTTDGCS